MMKLNRSGPRRQKGKKQPWSEHLQVLQKYPSVTLRSHTVAGMVKAGEDGPVSAGGFTTEQKVLVRDSRTWADIRAQD